MKETITHLTFRLTVKNHLDYDVEGLAKAAVNGDEHALDMFSNWRPKTTARKFRVQEGSDNLNFFIATQAGKILSQTTYIFKSLCPRLCLKNKTDLFLNNIQVVLNQNFKAEPYSIYVINILEIRHLKNYIYKCKH